MCVSELVSLCVSKTLPGLNGYIQLSATGIGEHPIKTPIAEWQRLEKYSESPRSVFVPLVVNYIENILNVSLNGSNIRNSTIFMDKPKRIYIVSGGSRRSIRGEGALMSSNGTLDTFVCVCVCVCVCVQSNLV